MSQVSIILPVHNAEAWVSECLQSVYNQTFTADLQLSVYNDCSTDRSGLIVEDWRGRLEGRGIHVIVSGHDDGGPRGVGFAKNRAVEQSTGLFLCFLDADDVMHKDRIIKQLEIALHRPGSLIGSRFHREPPGSTARYTEWANNLTEDQFYTQAYTSHGPTVIMPTWFCSRETFNKVGNWDESGKGTPEDLLFFYKHLELGGQILRVDQDLLTYRYHEDAATFSVLEETIWKLRVSALEERILSKWSTFTIWNAGKQGRYLYRSLTSKNRQKVAMFCDVDEKKIAKGVYIYEESTDYPRPRVPIVHFTKAVGPFIICVKQNLTGGGFEANLRSLSLTEGEDYIHFN